MKGLTDRQQHILRYIGEYSRDYGYPPTVREIGKEV
ncbi:MAG: repressor LexA, partial [Chloroflexi bacterium]|nr:repressor LexA [Chloroflexota bacterium]